MVYSQKDFAFSAHESGKSLFPRAGWNKGGTIHEFLVFSNWIEIGKCCPIHPAVKAKASELRRKYTRKS